MCSKGRGAFNLSHKSPDVVGSHVTCGQSCDTEHVKYYDDVINNTQCKGMK